MMMSKLKMPASKSSKKVDEMMMDLEGAPSEDEGEAEMEDGEMESEEADMPEGKGSDMLAAASDDDLLAEVKKRGLMGMLEEGGMESIEGPSDNMPAPYGT